MIRSMTAFGEGRCFFAGGEFSVEVRSVNGRYLEVRARLPGAFAALEPALVQQVRARLFRGHVDLTVRRRGGASAAVPRIDEAMAEHLVDRLQALQSRLGLGGELRVADLLSVDGLVQLEEPELDLEEAEAALRAALDEALERLVEMREREGASLRADVEARLDRIEALRARIEALAPEAIAARQQAMRERIEELLQGPVVEPQRIAQEVAVLAERMDVAEELTRLASHVEQGRRLLAGDEPAGRRLDFLVQEMNREANTIAAKASWMDSAEIVVDLKAEIERIREQVQNIE